MKLSSIGKKSKISTKNLGLSDGSKLLAMFAELKLNEQQVSYCLAALLPYVNLSIEEEFANKLSHLDIAQIESDALVAGWDIDRIQQAYQQAYETKTGIKVVTLVEQIMDEFEPVFRDIQTTLVDLLKKTDGASDPEIGQMLEEEMSKVLVKSTDKE